MKFLMILVVSLFSVSASALKEGEGLRLLPVQDGGRIKPYDTFANETLEVVSGKKTFEGNPAWQVVFTWMLAPDAWTDKELFEVRHHEIVSALGLDPHKRLHRGDELFAKERFSELMQDLRVRRESKEKMTPAFQALQRLENQYFVFREMSEGRLLRIWPNPESHSWISVADLPEGPARDAFGTLTAAFVEQLSSPSTGTKLDCAVSDFQALAHAASPGSRVSTTKLRMEVHYNDFHPFRWASIFYLLSALAVLAAWIFDARRVMPVAWVLVVVGFLLNTYGFGLRVYLAERPPVSNMYETVVWVAWGGVLFAAILEKVYRSRFILLAGTLAGFIGLVVADVAPAVLDPSLQPLEAVLRSNYWLIVHVMTITISYAAFFLAFILGDIALLSMIRKGPDRDGELKGLVTAIYRCFQIGVAFLAPGIILGGVWADYSWGRFWGWDPKETWALIALLGYLAVLHGRMTNWIKDFGMIVSAVVTFSLVVMAWYGVNFVLGAGLHSYGFGAGGVEYVSAVLFAHVLLVLYVWMLRRSRRAD